MQKKCNPGHGTVCCFRVEENLRRSLDFEVLENELGVTPDPCFGYF